MNFAALPCAFAELRETELHFVVPPENPLRKRDVFFEKVGRFVTKQGNFFVFVAHFVERPIRGAMPPWRREKIAPRFRFFPRVGHADMRVAIAYAHFTEFLFSMFTLHLHCNSF